MNYLEKFLPIRSRFLASLIGLLVLAGPIAANDFTVKITAARVGLPQANKMQDESGPSHVSKFAAWAPVYIELEPLAEISDPVKIVVESVDSDEISTTLAVPLNLFPLNLSGAKVGNRVAAADLGAIGYIRPAGIGEATIT